MSLSANELTLRRFQSEVADIRESPLPRAPRVAIWLLAALLTSFVASLTFVDVDRVISSQAGKIVSTQAVTVFQALDTSLIKKIDVKEGQAVSAGQVLATLDQTFAAADVAQLRRQLAGLDAQIERAQAELEVRSPIFVGTLDADHERYAAIQRGLYNQRKAQYNAQLVSFDQKIRETEATIDKYKNDEGRYAEREKISKQIEDMRATLMERQAGSLLNLLGATDQRLEMLRYMEIEHNSLIEAQHHISSIKGDEEAFKQQWAAALSEELVTARNARDLASAQYVKATKHQDLVVLRAPEDSVVLTLARLSVGSVLKEGDSLMTLMPSNTPMEADIHVASRDIGFLRAGDPAIVKIDAFNSAEHGFAEGSVKWISEGAFGADDDGKPVEPFYRVRLGIEKFRFTGVPRTFRLIPGMTLGADIKVGHRSLFRYFVGGALRGLGESMREP